ncbi:hypothetical protein BHE74_00015955 [Ensete ventricosum]|nr:hypothetical protein BHE74_00015955 [Ensete ventricosum]
MATASASEVERESCQTSELRFCRRGVDRQLRLRKRAVDGVGICYRLIARKKLVMPSLQSTERRWAMALIGALGRENKGCRRDDAGERV